jgi:hypothetical protein
MKGIFEGIGIVNPETLSSATGEAALILVKTNE